MRPALVLLVGGLQAACPSADGPALAGSTGTSATSFADSETDSVTGPADAGESAPTTSGTSTTDTTTTSTSTSGTTTANLDNSGAPGSSGSGSGTTTETGDPEPCGNGLIDPDEQCDDGNDDANDACAPDCTLGPADKGEVIALELLPHEDPTCMTVAGAGLMVGSTHIVKNEMTELYAHLQQLPLPGGAPVGWSYHEKAGDYGRYPQRAATASNGDVIVGGLIHTELQKPDSGGYLWLARFTAAGELVWNREFDNMAISVHDLALGPNDDIVVVANSMGFGGGQPSVAVVSGAGDLLWQFYEPILVGMEYAFYTGVAVGDDGGVYVSGYALDEDDDDVMLDQRMILRALTSAGAPVWLHEHAEPAPLGVTTGDVVFSGGRVVLTTTTVDPARAVKPG